MPKTYHVYILASRRSGTLYTGVTGDLARRGWQHKSGRTTGFTQKYSVHRLVYSEPFDDIHMAIAREKAIKKWRRAWKLALIEKANPDWNDLFEHLT